MDIVSTISTINDEDNTENVAQNNDKDPNDKANSYERNDNYEADGKRSEENVKLLYSLEETVLATGEGNIEKISGKEAESRFLLWYKDIQTREEWYKRRIEELEIIGEKYKRTIANLKYNDQKLQERYSKALIEIKVLRKKNMLPTDDEEFLKSYISLTSERDNLIKSSHENNDIIKKLKKEMLIMRTKLNLNQVRRPPLQSVSTQTKFDKVQRHYTHNISTEADVKDTIPNQHLYKTTKFQENVFHCETKFTSSVSYSSKQELVNKKWDRVLNKSMKRKKQGKESPSFTLPDIQERPGHMMWRY